MAGRKRKASRDIDLSEVNTLHCDLKVELHGMVDPKLKGYDDIIIRCEQYMTNIEVQQCKENGLTEICDVLERKGKFGTGNYDVLRKIFKDINEPAVNVIDKYQGEIDKLILKNQVSQVDEICPGILKSWREDDRTFYPTKATKYIYDQVKKERKIIVSGCPAVGKSANVHHIALQLKDEGYQIFRVQQVKEMVEKTYKLGEVKQVYIFDDVFGVHGVREEKRLMWSEESENKDDLERCLENPNVIILCTSRLQVILDDTLSSIRSHFTIINISQGDIELSSDEHVEIFRKHVTVKERFDLLKNKYQLTNDVEQKIRQVKCPLGCFPLLCRLFTGDKETKQTIEEYFSKPLKVIAKMLNNLRTEEPIRHFCLLLCLIYDNKLPVNTIEVACESEHDEKTKQIRTDLLRLCELPASKFLQTIKNKMETLLQTFIKREGDTYQFVHDIIHDAVIKHVNDLSSSLHQVIMSHCNANFLLYRIHLSGVVCKSLGHDTELCINIRPDSFICWGVRVLDIIRDGVRTSDELYNDIDEGRCSKDDRRVRYDNPWWDVFVRNPCVHSTEGQTAIVQALASKSSSDVQTIVCTNGYTYSLYEGRHRLTALHWFIFWGLTHIVRETLSMIPTTRLHELDSADMYGGGLLRWAWRNTDMTEIVRQKLQEGQNVTKS